MKSGLLVSDRHSLPRPWAPRSLLLLRSLSRIVVAKSSNSILLVTISVPSCTSHSDAKKAHEWSVDQITDLFRTTHKVKTQQLAKNRGQQCGDIQLSDYLANEAGPVPLVLDLRIVHERFSMEQKQKLRRQPRARKKVTDLGEHTPYNNASCRRGKVCLEHILKSHQDTSPPLNGTYTP